jgi:hypothetical protein
MFYNVLLPGYTTYEELLYLKYGKEKIYHLHHLLAALITIYSCVYPKLHFFICWGGTIEITGIFVNCFLISKRFNCSSTITNIFGGLMWLSFVIFRFVSLILMFIVIFTDSYYEPRDSVSRVALPYLIICGISSVVLFILSLFWLGKMSHRLSQILFSSYQSTRLVHPEIPNSESGVLTTNQQEHPPARSSQISTKSPSLYPSLTLSVPVCPILEENNEDSTMIPASGHPEVELPA